MLSVLGVVIGAVDTVEDWYPRRSEPLSCPPQLGILVAGCSGQRVTIHRMVRSVPSSSPASIHTSTELSPGFGGTVTWVVMLVRTAAPVA